MKLCIKSMTRTFPSPSNTQTPDVQWNADSACDRDRGQFCGLAPIGGYLEASSIVFKNNSM
jgi:hypothetical protein